MKANEDIADVVADLREALYRAVCAMEDQDIFGDDPRITAAVNRANDVLRRTEPKPEKPVCGLCADGRVLVYRCEGPCECGLCPDVEDCPHCSREKERA